LRATDTRPAGAFYDLLNVDWWGLRSRTPSVLFLRGVNAEAYFDLVIEPLSRLT
jgi:hypothetical protein